MRIQSSGGIRAERWKRGGSGQIRPGTKFTSLTLQEVLDESVKVFKPDSEGKVLYSSFSLIGSPVHLWSNHCGQGNQIKPAPPVDILGVETNQSSFCFLWFVLDFLFPTKRVALPWIQVSEVLVFSTQLCENGNLFWVTHQFWVRLTQEKGQGQDEPLSVHLLLKGSGGKREWIPPFSVLNNLFHWTKISPNFTTNR